MPPVSEAQRRLMHAAAAHKGGAGGVSQAVGKEFSGADKPGKLPERNSKSAKMYGKGFARGGVVPAPKALRTGGSAGYADGGQVGVTGEEADFAITRKGHGKAKGGKIKHTSGPPIGRDDGLIPAQKGEYVIRKAAVKKLGVAALNEINKGNLSKAAQLYSKKAVHHG